MQEEILQAYERIQPYLTSTMLCQSDLLSEMTSANVYLKLENLQPTHSFKVRGAINKMSQLKQQNKRQVITASTGNHGAAVAYACQLFKMNATIVVPENVSMTKLENIKRHGGQIIYYGNECAVAEQHARQLAVEKNIPYISPYNDFDIIHGQGTIGVELEQQLTHIDELYCCIGGGGLISGIASYLKNIQSNIVIHGCLPTNSPVMYECVKAGKIIQVPTYETLADASAGNMDADSITFSLCQKLVDKYHLSSEDEIKAVIKLMLDKEHLIVEGATATSIAALINRKNIAGSNIVVIISGSNIDSSSLKNIL